MKNPSRKGGHLQTIYKLRLPALFCAIAVLLCELISQPFANMGVVDDWPYILMVQKLAATGHVVYNGWAAPMLTWQLYLADILVKLFGFSFTTVRASTLLVAIALAFILQRTLVRSGLSEPNATLGTLAFVLSPLYLMISPTFMTDIHGLFAIVLCLYGCLRALQSATTRATLAWLCFAVAANAIVGTSRQIAWLGILIMVPSTLYLLRANRRVLIAGLAATLAGVAFIFACLHWLKHQPYTIPEHLLPQHPALGFAALEFFHTTLDIPFFLLPIFAIFLPQIRKSRPRVLAVLALVTLAYVVAAILQSRHHPGALLEPLQADWVNIYGVYRTIGLKGHPPLFLHPWIRILFTIASLGGLLGFIAALTQHRTHNPSPATTTPTWRQLAILLLPFFLAYNLLLIPRAAETGIFDRYLLAPLIFYAIVLIRFYQERIHPRLPLATALLILFMAIYGVAATHNMFALYRARVQMAAELRSAGIPDTAVDNGWEYHLGVELQYAPSINSAAITVPANFPITVPPPIDIAHCNIFFYNDTPHIHPRYAISFIPNTCYGPAPFAPIHYSRWLSSPEGTLYVVNAVSPNP